MRHESVTVLFDRAASRAPSAVAVSRGGVELTYAELQSRAGLIAQRLLSEGAGKGSVVAILLDDTVAAVTSIIAVLKASAAFVPLDTRIPALRLDAMLEDVSPSWFITERKFLDRLGAYPSARVLCLDGQPDAFSGNGVRAVGTGDGGPPEGAALRAAAPSPDDHCYIYFTSGSTGRPKGIAGRLKGVDHFIRWEIEELGVGEGSRVSQLLPLSFDGSLRDIFVPLCSGGTLCVPDDGEVVMDAQRLVAWLDRERINVVHCVPSLLRAMLNEGLTPENFRALKYVLLTGEALLPSDVGRWMEVFGDRVQLINLYGTSETTMAKFVYRIRPGDEGRRTIPVGKPMPGARALILNEDGRACPPGGIGEIYIRTPYRSLGYYKQPELTREVFVPNPFGNDPGDIVYKTGDLGRLLEDGNVELLGRKDRQVKIRGVRVELEEIEGLLRGGGGVKDVAVVDREDSGGNKYLCAYVVGDGELNLNALRELLMERLPNSMLPSAFVVMERLPRTISGKLDRRALPSPAQMLARRRGELDAPTTAVEEVLAGLWCEVLGLEQVGVHDNFFELGGHSLLATQVLARAREAFRVEVALRQMFEAPTVFGLAQCVEAALREGQSAAAARPIERVAGATRLPLSYAQQRLWLIDRMGTNRAAYNIPGVMGLDGDLNVHALEQTLDEITRRHETLRTVFSFDDELPLQVITPHAWLRLPLVDLTGLPENEREVAAARLAREEASRPFDLSTGPLVRVRLLRLSGRSHRLLFAMHHIISDAWSMGVLIREVAALYEAFAKGGPSPLAELAVQYADFAVWQRGWLRDEALESQMSYWRRQLEGAPPELELPTDRPRPAVKTFKGVSLPVSVSAELTAALRSLARREGATLHMVLLAAWQALLSKYSGQKDVLVGTPVANRARAEFEPLIGFFVNTLVLRTNLSGDPSFRELLSRVREVCLGAYAHQDVPFEILVEELKPERSLSRTPLFQVAFALQNVPTPSIELAGLSLSTIEAESGAAKFDLTLSMFETAEGLAGSVEYNADLFDAATAERMAAHFVRLLEGAVAEPGRRVSGYELLSPEERRRVLVEWNETAREFPAGSTVHELFEAQAAARPDAVAVVHEETRLTYGELNRRANRLAHKLRRLGVGHEVPVGLFMESGVEAVVCILAVLKAGGAYVPLDLAYPLERLRFMTEDAGLRLVLTRGASGAALAAEFSPAGVGVVDLSAAAGELALESSEDPERVATPDSAAYVLYTSGSTGRPKGVCVTHRNVVRLVRGNDYVSLSAGETILQMAPLSFDASTFELWGALLNGGRCVLHDSKRATAGELREVIEGEGVTTMWLTSALFNAVVEEDARSLGGLSQLVVGGEALSARHVREALRELKGVRLVNGYGPTEATTFTCCHQISEADGAGESWERGVPIGRPIANAEVYILDEGMRPVPVGVAGELYVAGDGLARGYVRRPGLTAEKFVPNPFSNQGGERLYRTGDVTRYLPDGTIEFIGRVDQQVKVRGHRIELGEVESVLSSHPAIAEAVAVARGEGVDKRVVAYFVPSDVGAGAPSVSELRGYMGERVPQYMVPQQFVMLESLPLNANGKVDRKALPEPEGERPELEAEYVAPRTPLEELLAGLWAEVLGVERVGAEDSFFDLGGHSLMATQVLARVRAALGVELPLRTLFETPTLAGQAAHVEAALDGRAASTLPPLAPEPRFGPLPLSFAQQRLWFIDQLEPGGAAYNSPAAVRFKGALNVAALEQSLDEIVRRHEALRTSFAARGGEPLQVVAQSLRLTLPTVDLSGLPDARRESEARRIALAEARRAFDLGRAPLLRVRLLRTAADEHVALLTMHHIISDGWSVGLLIGEVSALYAAYAAGAPSPLAELAVQYADFAVWQRRWLRGAVLDEQLSYWRRQLAGAPPALELPTDRPRPRVQTYCGAYESFELSEELTESLKSLGGRLGATFFMTLLAAFVALLHRYTGQTDIVVGSPVANRRHLNVEGLIGFFVNALVLRVDASGDPTFAQLLARVRETCLGAYAHQDLPFEELVEKLQPERDMSRHPLFQVVFALQNAPMPGVELPRLTLAPVEATTGTSKFDMTVLLAEADGGLNGSVEYSTDLFDGATVARMLRHFETLLKSVAADPAERVGRLALLGKDERSRVLFDWNDTARDYPRERAVHELFAEQAARTPDADAVVGAEGQLTYAELNARANRLARRLRSLGVGPEVPVGLFMGRGVETVVALLAVLKAGGAYVPLDTAYPAERLRFMLEDSRVRVVLTHGPQTAAPPECDGVAVVSLDELREQLARESDDDPPRSADAENLAYVLYTSGSTGRPKGVCVTHRNVVRLVRGSDYVSLTAGETILQMAPLSFDASTFELWGALLNGGRLVLMETPNPSPDEIGEALSRHRVTTLWLTAGLFNLMVDERPDGLRPLRQLLAGGDVLSVERVARALERLPGCRLVNGYGPTECTTFSCCHAVTARDTLVNSVPIGRPIANAQAYVLDRDMQPAPVGVAGKLYVGGDGLARGYLNRPGLTAERFLPDPFSREVGARLYRTGDIARWLPDGTLEFLGREDAQVKVSGFRIEPGEVEDALLRHGSLREAAVVAWSPDGAAEKRLVAYVVPAAGREAHAGELREYLRERLPEFMVPSSFVTLASLPLSPNGKVERGALPPPGQTRPELAGEYVAPRTPLEELLAGLWAEVLGVERVGAEDSFFDLGGHSLMATQLVSRVNETLQTQLPLSNLFEAPTVAALSRLIVANEASPGSAEKIALMVKAVGAMSDTAVEEALQQRTR